MESLKTKFAKILPYLDEKQRRLYLASEAEALGRGGKTLVSKLANISRPTIDKAVKELHSGTTNPEEGVRKPGGGRKKLTEHNKDILAALEALVDPVSRGDPESALRWTIKSVRNLSEELCSQGHKVGKSKVSDLLEELGYSLQSNRKKIEGNQRPDRDGQFRYTGHGPTHRLLIPS